MRPGPAAVCPGRVWHRRLAVKANEFTYTTSHVWLDPDRPEQLCDLHPRWSTDRLDVVRFRADDYGRLDAEPTVDSLGDQVRDDLAPVLGHRPDGPVRMISQLRRWGWLFNPITIFLVWPDTPGCGPVQGAESTAAPNGQGAPNGRADADGEPDRSAGEGPIGAVLEVTNTPWKERHRYPLALDRGQGGFEAEFPKRLHVSPFLTLDHVYRLRIADRDDRVDVALDVVDESGRVVLKTALSADRRTATRATVAAATWRPILPTHRVSLGIHRQAARLWRKGVPFVAHPAKRSRQSTQGVGS